MNGYFEYSLEATLYLHDVMMVTEISLMTKPLHLSLVTLIVTS